MSLLLKALKQAESDDLAGSGRSATGARQDPALDLEPRAAPAPAQAHEWVEPPGLLFGGSAEPAPAPPRRAPAFRLPRLSLVPMAAAIAALIALGYGIHLYFALQPPATMPASSPATVTPPGQLLAETYAPPAADTPPPASVPSPLAASPAETPPPAETPAAANPRPSRASPAVPVAPVATPTASPVPQPAAVLPRFQADTQSSLLARAWTAYRRGALDEAHALYAQTGERSVDGLLGLAAIACQRNDDAEALRRYRQVLELDPRNALAQGALLDLLGNTDAAATETRLKILIEREPNPQLYQTLGNLYAGQQRWNEAQAAYFEAVRGAPDNADYAFNLAVSLDQLHQYAAALTYYEKALARGGAHRFDRAQAETRVQQLKTLR